MGRPQCRFMNAKLVSKNSMVMYILHDQDLSKLRNEALVSRLVCLWSKHIQIRPFDMFFWLSMDVDGQMCCFLRYCNFTEG